MSKLGKLEEMLNDKEKFKSIYLKEKNESVQISMFDI
ncbi:hypothetical protein [Herbivorax sp. ANBcel31]